MSCMPQCGLEGARRAFTGEDELPMEHTGVLQIRDRRWTPSGTLERRLATLQPTGSDAYTLYLPPEEMSSQPPSLAELVPDLASWPTGAVLFASSHRQVAVFPPFPVPMQQRLEGWDARPLMDLLREERNIAVVLIRLGRFAVGIFQGSRMVASKTDTRYVKGKHKAGGTSQLRFQRIREKQAREIFDKTCVTAQRVFTPHQNSLQYLALGGERHTLLGLQARCPYLVSLGVAVLPRTLDVRVPNHDALENCGPMLYESLVVEVE